MCFAAPLAPTCAHVHCLCTVTRDLLAREACRIMAGRLLQTQPGNYDTVRHSIPCFTAPLNSKKKPPRHDLLWKPCPYALDEPTNAPLILPITHRWHAATHLRSPR